MNSDDAKNWEIEPGEVVALIGNTTPEMELVDVREDWELTRGILPGAVHVPLSKFGEFQDRWQADRQYVIYCEHGVRSLDVVIWLETNKSIHAKSMRGGFAEWTGPIKSAPGGEP